MSRNADSFLFPDYQPTAHKPPVLIGACLLGFPCRWYKRRAKRREELFAKQKQKYTLVPVCPEQLGGMPTPRTSETLSRRTGAEVLERSSGIVAAAGETR